MTLFYNDKTTKLKDALLENSNNVPIYVATAFFSNTDILKQFMYKRCNIKLIIRLNTGTSAKELEKLTPFMYSGQIEIRFFTDEHFHPKFYIFGDKTAFIGSSNLTNNGIEENQEMNIQIDDKETIFQLK
ncbi:phospholipase D family protein, partial [Treponema sp. JC4]|uniref:phospholipase D family protein n=1 Tax=Treponema sp. JC4 TaxID=1124982 RepID=UPI0005880671